MPENPETFKPVIPKWPTPSGKTENGAKKTCTAKLRATETFKACKRVLRNRFNIKAAVEQCVADVLVSDHHVLFFSVGNESFVTYLWL